MEEIRPVGRLVDITLDFDDTEDLKKMSTISEFRGFIYSQLLDRIEEGIHKNLKFVELFNITNQLVRITLKSKYFKQVLGMLEDYY